MNKIISSILQAEKYSEDKLIESSKTSKEIIKNARVESDKIKENAVDDFKILKKTKILEAEKNAEKEYNKKIKIGESEADSIINAVEPKIDKVVKDTLKYIVG